MTVNMIWMLRGDIDQTALKNRITKYAKNTDHKFVSNGSINWTYVNSINGDVIFFTGALQTQAFLNTLPGLGYAWVALDEEPVNLSDLSTMITRVHTAGMSIAVSALYGDVQNHTASLAACDMVIMQIPHTIATGVAPDAGLTYRQIVKKYTDSIKATNAACKVCAQINLGNQGSGNDPYPELVQINAINQVKGYVDFILIDYFNSGDPAINSYKYALERINA